MVLNCSNIVANNQGDFIDIDGNVYKTIQFGNQIWMAENLRTTRFNNGRPIPNIIDNISWANDTVGAFCFYNNTSNSDTIKMFGALYNWYSVNTKKLEPKGWHVPTDDDWSILERFLKSKNSMFSALPAGCRYTGRVTNNFEPIGSIWWSSSENKDLTGAWVREFGCDTINICKAFTNCKVCGFSVRLIKDGPK